MGCFNLIAHYANLIGPLGPECVTPIESYGAGDGEKRACNLSQFQSLTNITHNSECVVYSIGMILVYVTKFEISVYV